MALSCWLFIFLQLLLLFPPFPPGFSLCCFASFPFLPPELIWVRLFLKLTIWVALPAVSYTAEMGSCALKDSDQMMSLQECTSPLPEHSYLHLLEACQ